MHELQTNDQRLLKVIMDEYETVLTAVDVSSYWNDNYLSHVPTFIDVMCNFESMSSEELMSEIYKLSQQHRILFSIHRGYINFPLVEVW